MFIKPFIYEPAKHLQRLIKFPEYLVWCYQDFKFGNVKRFSPRRTKIHGFDIFMPDAASFLATYKELFVNRIYEFEFPEKNPKILDLGANIGLSVLFFKSIFPNAEIDAYEADPLIFEYLTKNINGNNVDGVNLYNKAVWTSTGLVNFYPEGADGGGITSEGNDNINPVSVASIDISEVLSKKTYDFLKMDIEGAENDIFPMMAGSLSNFNYIFLEYHSRPEYKQSLSDILKILSNANFRVEIFNAVSNCTRPFMRSKILNGYDLQLNIFARKA